MLKIANSYGNIDLVHNTVPKGYQFVPGKRLTILAKKLNIKVVKAITAWKKSRRYPTRPIFGGVVCTKKSAIKLLEAIAAREAKANDPKTIEAKNRAAIRREKKKEEFAERYGVEDYHTPLARAIRRGDVDERNGKLLAFIARYRHEFTDYDQQFEAFDWQALRKTFGYEQAKAIMREEARQNRVEESIPDSWDEYLLKYDFTSETAKALASVLRNPTKAHPIWFKKAELACEGMNVNDLNYERIKAAIARVFGCRYD